MTERLWWAPGLQPGSPQHTGTVKAHHKPEIPPPFFLVPFGKGEANAGISTSWLLMNHNAVPSLQPGDAVLLNHG